MGLVGWTVESLILMTCLYNNNDYASMLEFPSLTKLNHDIDQAIVSENNVVFLSFLPCFVSNPIPIAKSSSIQDLPRLL